VHRLITYIFIHFLPFGKKLCWDGGLIVMRSVR